MDMATKFQDQVVFHMTGRRSGDGLLAVDGAALRPAVLAGYRHLSRLRHDFPVVLVSGDAEPVQSLTAVVNRMLEAVAPRGIEGERLRKLVLRLERELRALVEAGVEGSLSQLWARATQRLDGVDTAAAEALAHAGAALPVDGELVGCDERLAARCIAHQWQHLQRDKAGRFHRIVDRLIRQLADIQRAAFLNSQAGRAPQALRASVGDLHVDVFDFGALSKLVARGVPDDELPAPRRRRIEWALSVLRAQSFYPDPARPGAPVDTFAFDDCASAVDAYRARLPRLVELVKAIAVAELEASGAYVEPRHDPFFERFNEHSLSADDLALFPDYLVCIRPDENDAPRNAGLLQMLSAGLPVKVVVQFSDLVEETSNGVGQFAFGVRSSRLATTAMGLGGMFVLQSTSSNLVALRDRVRHGLAGRCPALFCVYAGARESTELPPYLSSAVAMESRAFPAFTYDAAAGANWAARFSLENNRDAGADWPIDRFEYADETLQRVPQDNAFTYADFALCDTRHAAHFALVPPERWNAAMVPAAQWLALPENEVADRVPYLLAVDGEDRLQRVVVDVALMHATRRCLLLWHRLQEHGGVNNSHAERALAREKALWEAQQQQQTAVATAEAAAAAPAVAPAAVAADAPADKPSSDEAWIETARCPSCNECQIVNDRMFKYNDNQQAYIADITAGTYRQLVEAAEACQVAIIHPGKPRDPNEPGLDELIERAKPFM